jgi:hypothetical protein
MSVRSRSSSQRADPVGVAAAAALGIAVFSLAWAVIHGGFYDDAAIIDTPVYQGYGDRVVAGEVPYRDFELEYPPGALPVFVLPSLGNDGSYVALFEALMLACGAAAVAFVAAALAAAGVDGRSLFVRTAAAGAAPLLLGPVVLSRFDLWPAALTIAALAALAAGRDRVGLGVLGGAVAAKLYPVVLLPLALLYVWRRRGRREAVAALGVFALVLAVVFGPFLLVAPDGVVASFERQTGRPLQLESLGASLLLAADRLGLYAATVVSSHGSQNLAGALPDTLASIQTVVQALALLAVWIVFARSRRGIAELFAASAAAVAASIAFGKVLSPQFLIWLVPLVPLVLARTRLAGALFAGALAATLLWFPYRYWDVVALEPIAWAVLVRDALLLALFAVLLAATARGREAAHTT